MAKFPASDEDSNTREERTSKNTKELEDSGKKRRTNTLIYCSIHGDNNRNTSREYKFLKSRYGEKYESKYVKRDYNNKFKELNLLQVEAAHQQ